MLSQPLAIIMIVVLMLLKMILTIKNITVMALTISIFCLMVKMPMTTLIKNNPAGKIVMMNDGIDSNKEDNGGIHIDNLACIYKDSCGYTILSC